MELAQSILTSAIYVIWYGFSTIFIFDFLIGLPALMQQAALKCRIESIQAVDQEQSVSENPSQELNSTSISPISNADEATLQYLEMVGADTNDFETIAQARQFLDEHAPWTIEIVPAQSGQLVSNTGSSISAQPITEPQEKLTCVQVKTEFAKLGWVFEKYRTGHYRYRVKVNGIYQRFQTLQDALDWLEVSRRLIRVAAPQ